MRADELFIQSNLAETYRQMGSIETALPHYERATDLCVETLSHPFEESGPAVAFISRYAKFCHDEELFAQSSRAANRVKQKLDIVGPECANAALLMVSWARFLFVTKGRGAIDDVFESMIAEAEDAYGVRSDQAQSHYASYAQVLFEFGFVQEAVTTLRDRLYHLDYWFEDRIIIEPPESESRDRSAVKRQIEKFDKSCETNAVEITGLESEGSAAYQSGRNEDAHKAYLTAADLGSRDSQFMIGTFFQCGIGCEINMEKAREYYLYASRRGHMVAQHYYGALIQMGLGGDADINAAAYWYSKAYDQGYPPAIKNLYATYATVTLNRGSVVAGIEILLKSVEAGDLDSMELALNSFRSPIQALVKI